MLMNYFLLAFNGATVEMSDFSWPVCDEIGSLS